MTVASIYVVNGKEVGDPAYDVKLAFYDALRDWSNAVIDPTAPAVLAGDFNVTPDDRDVHDPELWRGRNLASEPERGRLRALLDTGLVDLGRDVAGDVTGPFTFWDYRMGAFHRGWGLRIDLMLGTEPVRERVVSVEVDREERKPTSGEGKPSDHAPLDSSRCATELGRCGSLRASDREAFVRLLDQRLRERREPIGVLFPIATTPVGRRAHARVLAERRGEVRQAVEAHPMTDLRDRELGLS